MPGINSRTQTQLTAPGTSAYLQLSTGRASKWYEITIATIDTNVIVQVEYSTTGSGAATKLAPAVTFTENGTYVLPVFDVAKYVRFNFVSESGGTAATITPVLKERVAD